MGETARRAVLPLLCHVLLLLYHTLDPLRYYVLAPAVSPPLLYHLAFTRYDFTSNMYCGCLSSFYCPPHLQRPRYCNTSARLLRNIRPSTDRPFVCHTFCTFGDGDVVLNNQQVTRTQHTRQKQRRHRTAKQQNTHTHTRHTHSTTDDNGLVAVVRVVVVAHKIVVGGFADGNVV